MTALTLSDVAFLAESNSQEVLAGLQEQDLGEAHTLRHLEALRGHFNGHQAGLLLSQARLRQRAVVKFGGDAMRMLFDTDALEQASHPLVRSYRAERMGKMLGDGARVLDAGCGLGADAFAMARQLGAVDAIDIDPVRVALARYNTDVLGLNVRARVADARHLVADGYDGIFYDPARRRDGKRLFNVEQYEPPLSLVRGWEASQVVVKLAPGVDWGQLAGYEGTLEFISVRGELKEAVLWLGRGVGLHSRATVIDGEGHVHHWTTQESTQADVRAPGQWLLEPDPAVIRAGLVRPLGRALDAWQLHEDIAYLTSDAPPNSPFVRAWRVQAWQTYNIKRLRKSLRERGIGWVTVKKRGIALSPQDFIKALKLDGRGASATLVVTRYDEARIVMICDDIDA